jgi:hypothetical protein
MKALRQIRLSVWRTLSDGFTAGTFLGTAYNVYGEADLRAGTEPVFPYVYILDFGVVFEPKHLPVVMLQTEHHKRSLEMGVNTWYLNVLALHVFGRDRGERDDIAGAIVETVDSITLRDFAQNSQPSVGTALLEPDDNGDVWVVQQGEMPYDVRMEGSLTNWNTCVCQFWASSTAFD